jgi:Heparinase II/III-like protein/Heparinase II/III N-terminus
MGLAGPMSKLGNLLQIGRTFGVRDGLLRLEYELQCGSGLMSRRMRSVQGWESWDLEHIAPKTSPEDLLSIRRHGGRPFFFSDSRNLALELKKVLGAYGEESVVAEANRILEGSLPFFGRLSFACGFPPKWFQNPATGQRVSPDRPWTQMRFASDDYGDLKFILEPSRFLFVYPLARAYAVSGDDRFPDAFWSAIENWAGDSPPMSGPLWICGQESSLRILAWSFALHAFLHSPATTPQRVALLLSMIAAHAWRTMQTVGYARSQRSNHLFSEAVGLWTAGTLYPELTDAAAWQKRGAQLLREAVLDQITPEGAYLQNSFNYQRMVLQQLLWVLRLSEIHKIQLDPEIHTRTAAAFEFIGRFVDLESGHAPNHGSNDGSYILPLATCDYGDFRPLVRLGSCVLDRPTALRPGPWDETALWLCGMSAKATERESGDRELAYTVSSTAGYHRIGTENSWALVRAGLYTRRPFQADQLHVDLWWHGLNLARDAGTYLYNGEPPWNNGLAGTAVHNTVTVDRRDQMRRAGRFLWLDWAQASGRSFSTSLSPSLSTSLSKTIADFPNSFEGEHDGYRRLGVKHRRMARCVTEDAWVIVDDLLGAGEHELRLHWLLPDLPFEVIADSPFCAILSAEKVRFRWNVFSSSPGNAAIIRGGKILARNIEGRNRDEELLGWESPTYGELCPALSLLYRVQARLPVRIVTVILAGEALQLRQSDSNLVLSRDALQVYQVSLAPEQTERGSPNHRTIADAT